MSAQYEAASVAPIIKSPSLWLPKPIELPMDIHPLPDDISAYFVYPFTLEPHILAQSETLKERLKASKESSTNLLKHRQEAAEKAKRDALNKIAPGYDPRASLVPLQRATPASPPLTQATSSTATAPSPAGQSQSTEDMFNSLTIN